ncbi:hypothetical protein [Kitasatospora sp. HPMI-4]|uniref:hypothetical protein n=1 Tax=Kitasatospora sp. HPMI-4 TaxID=3448443 RepID=UPI003F196590
MDLALTPPTTGPARSPEPIRRTAVRTERPGLATAWEPRQKPPGDGTGRLRTTT